MRPLNEITAEIRRLDRESAESVWSIGKLLNEAKSNTPHGQYAEWVLTELKFSGSYAARLVRLYNEYSTGLPAGFAISTLLCTLPLEEALRDQVNQIIQQAELTTQQAETLRAQAQKDSDAAAEKLARLNESKPDPEQYDKIREQIRAELTSEMQGAKPKKQKQDNSQDVERLLNQVTDLSNMIESMRAGYELKERERAAEATRLSEAAVAAQRSEASLRHELETARAEAISAGAKVKTKVVPPADYDELKQLASEIPALREAVRVLNDQRALSPDPTLSMIELEYLIDKLYNAVHPDEVEFERKRDPKFSGLMDKWKEKQTTNSPKITCIASPGVKAREARKRATA